jgi:hypothetical protein
MSEHERRLENLEMLIMIEGKLLLDDLDKTLTNYARATARLIKEDYRTKISLSECQLLQSYS